MTQPKTLSRRTFLLLSGAAAFVTAFPSKLPQALLDSITPIEPELIVGRALGVVPVYEQPGELAAVAGRIWPDNMTPIIDQTGDWYTVADGYIRRSDLQPMLAYDQSAFPPIENLPVALTVIAPVTVVRRWVGTQAPPVTRIGYGGVLWAVDRLVDDNGQVWYGLAAEKNETPLGWTRADHWAAVPLPLAEAPQSDRELVLDRLQKQVVARENGQIVFSVPAVVPEHAQRHDVCIDGRNLADSVAHYAGVPWRLGAAETVIYGAYWHNNFGQTADCAGWEVSPWAARWLYAWLPDGASVRVI
ncbi:hypothetical protein ACFLYO_00040 [Chloroflexota bacterium]